MRAHVLHRHAPIASAPLSWEERPDPRPGPGEVAIRLEACAVCRTDLHVIEGELAGGKLPVVPGHQAVGRIVQMGTGVAAFRDGDRAGVAWLRGTCGACSFCRRGRENLCPETRFTGLHADGGFAEQLVVPAAFAYPVPASFSSAEATPLLCAGIIGYRALARADVPPGGRLALFGFGSSAHVVIQIARHRGHEVLVVSRAETHLALARELGASWAGSTTAGMPGLVDSAIIFAPAGELVPAALEVLAPGGTLALAGIHMSRIPVLDYDRHLFRERNVRSVTANTREDGRGLLAEAARIPIHPRITEYALADANRALLDLAGDRIRGTGVLVP